MHHIEAQSDTLRLNVLQSCAMCPLIDGVTDKHKSMLGLYFK